jgi:hypothetical protein
MADSDPTAVPGAPTTSSDPADNVHELGRAVETGAQRLHRLQLETHRLAREQIEILNRDLNAMAQRIAEIADGGDVFPIGVRELCSRLTDDLTQQAQTLMVIMERAPKP